MLFRNKKHGSLYRIVGTVVNSTNGSEDQLMIAYQSEDAFKILGTRTIVYVREVEEFYEKFEKADV